MTNTSKPRFSVTVKDRHSGATITLDYESINGLAEDFGKILKVLAGGHVTLYH